MRNLDAVGQDDDSWKWIDGSPKSFTKWYNSIWVSDDDGEACAFMDDGYWYDQGCRNKERFICKRGKSLRNMRINIKTYIIFENMNQKPLWHATFYSCSSFL